jgi:hypothetical protein
MVVVLIAASPAFLGLSSYTLYLASLTLSICSVRLA